MTKKQALRIIKNAKDKDTTNYFNMSVYEEDMRTMLWLDQFGEAETEVIIAALVLAGAEFKER